MLKITTVPGGLITVNLSTQDEQKVRYAWATFKGDPVYAKKTFKFNLKEGLPQDAVKLRVCDIKELEFVADDSLELTTA